MRVVTSLFLCKTWISFCLYQRQETEVVLSQFFVSMVTKQNKYYQSYDSNGLKNHKKEIITKQGLNFPLEYTSTHPLHIYIYSMEEKRSISKATAEWLYKVPEQMLKKRGSKHSYVCSDSSSMICCLHFSRSLSIVAIERLPGSVKIFCRKTDSLTDEWMRVKNAITRTACKQLE